MENTKAITLTSNYGRIPAGRRVYAVGDVHGRADLLARLLELLAADATGYAGEIVLVSLGDSINRGPDSRGVLELWRTAVPAGWSKVFIRGNHEQALLNFVEDPEGRPEFMAWGGLNTLASYGVVPWGAGGTRRPLPALAAELAAALSQAGHGLLIQATTLNWVCGGWLFVHAGVRPGLALEAQTAEDYLFQRQAFLSRPHGLPYRVCFGHTIVEPPLVEDDKLGLDTGAFQSGVLTAACLEEERIRLVQARLTG